MGMSLLDIMSAQEDKREGISLSELISDDGGGISLKELLEAPDLPDDDTSALIEGVGVTPKTAGRSVLKQIPGEAPSAYAPLKDAAEDLDILGKQTEAGMVGLARGALPLSRIFMPKDTDSELIKSYEEEYPWTMLGGELVGSVLPITGAYKIANRLSKLDNIPRGLGAKRLITGLRAGLMFAGYQGETNPTRIAEEALAFGAGDVAFHGMGRAAGVVSRPLRRRAEVLAQKAENVYNETIRELGLDNKLRYMTRDMHIPGKGEFVMVGEGSPPPAIPSAKAERAIRRGELTLTEGGIDENYAKNIRRMRERLRTQQKALPAPPERKLLPPAKNIERTKLIEQKKDFQLVGESYGGGYSASAQKNLFRQMQTKRLPAPPERKLLPPAKNIESQQMQTKRLPAPEEVKLLTDSVPERASQKLLTYSDAEIGRIADKNIDVGTFDQYLDWPPSKDEWIAQYRAGKTTPYFRDDIADIPKAEPVTGELAGKYDEPADVAYELMDIPIDEIHPRVAHEIKREARVLLDMVQTTKKGTGLSMQKRGGYWVGDSRVVDLGIGKIKRAQIESALKKIIEGKDTKGKSVGKLKKLILQRLGEGERTDAYKTTELSEKAGVWQQKAEARQTRSLSDSPMGAHPDFEEALVEAGYMKNFTDDYHIRRWTVNKDRAEINENLKKIAQREGWGESSAKDESGYEAFSKAFDELYAEEAAEQAAKIKKPPKPTDPEDSGIILGSMGDWRVFVKTVRDIKGMFGAKSKSAREASEAGRKMLSDIYDDALKFMKSDNLFGASMRDTARRTTQNGKVVPNIRRSGAKALQEFVDIGTARSRVIKRIEEKMKSGQLSKKLGRRAIKVAKRRLPEFKDASHGFFGLPFSKDITRFCQEIDGSIPLEYRSKLKGQAGSTERFVLWPARDISKLKARFAAANQSYLEGLYNGISSKEATLINEILEATSSRGAYVEAEKFAQSPAVKEITGDLRLIEIAQETRKWLDKMLDVNNEFRELYSLNPINKREYYSPHNIKQMTMYQQIRALGSRPREVDISAPIPSYLKAPNKPFNPHELAREAQIPNYDIETDIRKIMADYANTTANDIFNTAIIENTKAYASQLESMGYRKAAMGLYDWAAETYGLWASGLDRTLSVHPVLGRILRRWRMAQARSVFPLNIGWNAFVQTSSIALTVARTGTYNTLRGLFDTITKPSLRKDIQKNCYSYIIKSMKSGEIAYQDVNRGMASAVRLERSITDSVTDAFNYFTHWTERALTYTSIGAGLRQGKRAGLKGQALWEYASDMGAKTQSMYNIEDLPAVLRSELVKTAFPFQTFTFEVMNTMRELAGKTGVPPATFRKRLGWLLRFFATVQAVNMVSEETIGRRVWAPYSFFPYADVFLRPLVEGKYTPKHGRGTPAPVNILAETKQGMMDVITDGNWRRLRRVFLTHWMAYITKLPGGVQLNKSVEGLIAVSEKGYEASDGDFLFPITDTKDEISAILHGVYATEEGKRYLKERNAR